MLGSLVVERAGEPVTLGPKQRTLLIILLLHGGGYVSVDRIIEWLYDEGSPPADAHKSLQVPSPDCERRCATDT